MNTERYRHIGKASKRMDAEAIVTGKTAFIDDVKIPGMIYGKILRSPHPHAEIRSIDTRRASETVGVHAVLTHADVPDWMVGLHFHQRFLDKRLRYVGDAVAIAAADTPEIAEAALDLIDVEYEVLPAVYDVEEALKPDAPQLFDAHANNTMPPSVPDFGKTTLEAVIRGNVEKGFAAADFVAQGTYGYENLPNPLPPEPPGVIVQWDNADKMTLWASTQCPNIFKMKMGKITGVPLVRCVAVPVGGSYGSKIDFVQIGLYAAALAKASHRPVKLYYTKEEHASVYRTRLGTRIHSKIGMKKDGTVTAVDGDWLVDTGAYSDFTQAMVAVGAGEAQIMVNTCENWHLIPKTVVTNRVPSGSVRGFGGQELKSALIPLWALTMAEAGLDPVEVFRENYVKPGGGYLWRDGRWYNCTGKDYTPAIVNGAKAFGWKSKWKGWLKPTRIKDSVRTGVGVSVHGNADVGEDIAEADVRIYGEGNVVLQCCVAESGMGERSSLCKMVAEVLKIPLERVSMSEPDTLNNPVNLDLIGSRGTYAVGTAVIQAAEEARKKLLKVAANRMEAPVEVLDTEDCLVFAKEKPSQKRHWKHIITPVRTVTGHGCFKPDYSKPNFMMTFVEVAVDVNTGKVELIHVLQATDVGQIIDPPSLEGQLFGGLGSAGTDTALFEETILDQTTGRILNANLIDYKWRTFNNLPKIDTAVLETGATTHRFKAVGAGEIATAPGPSAVLMAISNAIGKRFTEYPATPERILTALISDGKVD